MPSLPTPYQDFIHLSRYSRWVPDENRRESWPETVKRYFDFFEDHLRTNLNYNLSVEERKEYEDAVLNLEVLPSMRALMTAGDALKRDNVAGYNCAYTSINRPKAFDEILYILMCGTGVGFSVERAEVEKLPEVPEDLLAVDHTIHVADSRLGWSSALRELIARLYLGEIPKWDTSNVRAAGERLKTFGGRSSGPQPLIELFSFVVEVFNKAQGRKLTSLEVHDIVCKIAEVVVVGGVRRSALISLSSLTDDRMRGAKTGDWWDTEPQRALANNSAVYNGPVELGTFMDEWVSLYKSKSGERGIFNRKSAKNRVEQANLQRGDDNRHRCPLHKFGTNPCSEIILRDSEFCNLTEVVVRANETKDSLARKVRIASVLGTWQSTLTDFRWLSPEWKENCEDERLLGVSLTGIMDSDLTNGALGHVELSRLLDDVRQVAIFSNKTMAENLGVPQSAGVTCVKPSGTVSQLVDAASGIHPRHSAQYIRTVRADNKDPLCQFMIDRQFPSEPCAMKPDKVTVFSFPVESPKGSTTRNDMSALDQLELWLVYQRYWCEHKPSITVTVRENEWMDVGAWVWDHLDSISGISFLPHSDHIYQQAPYQEVTRGEYEALVREMPEGIDWSDLRFYEHEDTTTSSHTLACSGGKCEVVDLT